MWQSVPICGTGTLREVISAGDGTEQSAKFVQVAYPMAWKVLVLYGYWNVWIDNVTYQELANYSYVPMQ